MTNLDEMICALDEYDIDFTLGMEHTTDMEGYTTVSFTTCGSNFVLTFDNTGRFVGITHEEANDERPR